ASFNSGLDILAVRFATDTGFSSVVDTVKTRADAAQHYLHAGINDAGLARLGWIEYGLINNGGAYTFWNASSLAQGSWILASASPDRNSLDFIYGMGVRPDGTGLAVLSRGVLQAEALDGSGQPGGSTFPIGAGSISDADAIFGPTGDAVVTWRG